MLFKYTTHTRNNILIIFNQHKKLLQFYCDATEAMNFSGSPIILQTNACPLFFFTNSIQMRAKYLVLKSLFIPLPYETNIFLVLPPRTNTTYQEEKKIF